MKTPKILILNGPNLNLLGIREPILYGKESFESYYQQELLPSFPSLSLFQSNHEGDLIDALHETLHKESEIQGVVINAGAYSHTSLALADAIRSIRVPVVEVHLTNIYAREAIRRQSLLSECCMGVISGFGLESYKLALVALLHHLNKQKTKA